ncbi:MAG: bifunctional helix-turn-helix transcriptional regulator/GNAT family N-acetyltransferase [Eubacteriales bacterium]|nr:bifunctional helix-turn-helix transcriptional regulator/GNAT family N-acetyltransferase [Eubacteriales bacterium]
MHNIDIVTEIRGFNRFYTNILGLLDQHIIDSGYSLTEARILFEISKTDTCTAKQLCSVLDIERSYMSKIIVKFEKKELIRRQKCGKDSRNIEIQMTEKGMVVFHELNNRANKQIEDLLAKLNADDCDKLLDGIRTVKKYFTKATKNIKIRPYQEQDIAYVIDRQLSLYEAERQFTTETWKNYLIQGVISLVGNFNPDKDCMLILECDGNASGCIAITHTEENVAQLRYFFLEPELRGLGVGTNLIKTALDFCRRKKYSHVFLWTVSAQEVARKLYKNAGFKITETSKNESWGNSVLEERWDLDL